MKKEVIIPIGSAKPLAPYSPGIAIKNVVFTSGQIGINPETGKLVEGIEAQTKQCLENLKAVVKAADSSLKKMVKVTIFLTDINDYGKVNEIYGTYFPKNPPARSAFQVSALPAGALIEIEGIAHL